MRKIFRSCDNDSLKNLQSSTTIYTPCLKKTLVCNICFKTNSTCNAIKSRIWTYFYSNITLQESLTSKWRDWMKVYTQNIPISSNKARQIARRWPTASEIILWLRLSQRLFWISGYVKYIGKRGDQKIIINRVRFIRAETITIG